MVHFHNSFHWTHLRSRKAGQWGESLCGKWTPKRTTVTKNVTCSKCKAHVSFQKLVRDRDKRKRTNLGRYYVVVITAAGPWIHRKWQERRPSATKARNTLLGKARSKGFVVGYVYDSVADETLDVEHANPKAT